MIAKKTLINVLPYFIVQKYRESKRVLPSGKEPSIYNADGHKMSIYYLQDDLSGHNPYSMGAGRMPKNILWDRFNFGLKKHVYTHRNILKMCGEPQRKYALFLESAAILPKDYEIFSHDPSLAKEFDMVFTHSQKLLNELDNACWIPGGHVWYGGTGYEGKVSSELYLEKTKNISMLSSDKTYCDLHKLRIHTVQRLEKLGLVDGYGTYPGTRNGMTNVAETLQDYRYSIIFENNVEDYYFTEKILNCFEAMTVPIYLGARKIGDFFNADGIIQLDVKDIDQLDTIICKLGREDYEERINAIIQNYETVQDYLCFEDYLYNHYLKMDDTL